MGSVSKRLKKYEIPNPIFHYTITVVIAKDFNDAVKRLKFDSLGPYGDEVNGLHIFTRDAGESFLLFHSNAKADTVVHEVWHAVRHLLQYVGAELENEVVAYMLGYYTGEVLDILKTAKK